MFPIFNVINLKLNICLYMKSQKALLKQNNVLILFSQQFTAV